MNATLPLCIAQALAPFAPPQSMVHQIVRQQRLSDELADQYRTGLDCALNDDEHEARAWRGCLGGWTL